MSDDSSERAVNLSDSLPYLNITSPLCIPQLTDQDVDLNLSTLSNFAYYSTHDFHNDFDINECFKNKQSLFTLHCNIRSLSANFDNLNNMLSELSYPFALIGLSEVKLKVDQPAISNTDIPGYKFIAQPSLSNAGGVAFYVADSVDYLVHYEMSITTDNFEALWIEVLNKNYSNILCGVIYRHPTGNPENFNRYLNDILEKISQMKKTCIILGDFNLDLLKFETHQNTDEFLNSLGSNFFQPLILQPTRVTDHSATLIDNIFFNSLEYSVISGNIVYDLTDHLPNFLIINKYEPLSANISKTIRDFSKLNKPDLMNELNSINWPDVFATDLDPSLVFKIFYDITSQIIDRHIPERSMTRKEKKFESKPWITHGLKVSIQLKNKLYRKWIKTKSTYYHAKFKLYRNKINHLLKISKKKYYNEYFIKNSKDSKKVWKGIKEIVKSKPQQFKCTKIMNGNQEISDPKLIANIFNNYFSNVGKNFADSMPTVQNTPTEYLGIPIRNSFFISPTTRGEIEQEISKFKSSKAVGPFSIPIFVLKMVKSVISEPLEYLINMSFSNGIVPNDFKIANVIPIYKKGSLSCTCNYRPISLLSIFDKLLEKLMYKRLLNFLNKNIVLFERQFGFRTMYSTEYAILSIVDKVQKAIDNRNYACGIFLDFNKAFDTVNHEILIQKLSCYGVRGVA